MFYPTGSELGETWNTQTVLHNGQTCGVRPVQGLSQWPHSWLTESCALAVTHSHCRLLLPISRVLPFHDLGCLWTSFPGVKTEQTVGWGLGVRFWFIWEGFSPKTSSLLHVKLLYFHRRYLGPPAVQLSRVPSLGTKGGNWLWPRLP